MRKPFVTKRAFAIIIIGGILTITVCIFSPPKPAQATTQNECYVTSRSIQEMTRYEADQAKSLRSIANEMRNIRMLMEKRP